MPANKIFNIPLTLLKFIGEYMYRTSETLTAYRTINIIIMSVLMVFAIIPSFQRGHQQFSKIAEAILGVSHMLLKYILLIHNKPYVKELLTTDTGSFCDESYFDTAFLATEKHFLNSIRTVQLVLPISSVIAGLITMLRPAFHENRLFVLETFIADSVLVNTIILALQYYILLLIVPLIVGYDSFYLALCLHLVIQIKRLKYELECLSENDTAHNKLIYCIKYHQFLIETFVKLRRMFSFTLLFHYLVTLTSCCIELYELMGNGEFDIEQALNIFILFFQFGYYAFPAGQVASELDQVSTSIYASKWYGNPSAFQKLVLFVIARSQKQEQFSGGGMVPINEDTFGSVIRKSFSFYAVLRNVLNK